MPEISRFFGIKMTEDWNLAAAQQPLHAIAPLN